MKIKTSVTISNDILKEMDSLSGSHSNRSEFIETAVSRFIEHLRRERRNKTDLTIINHRSRRLNREACDVLAYQVFK